MRVQMATHSVERPDGARIVYHTTGPSPSVVLVHGWMACSAVWRPMLEHVSGVDVLAIDHRGTGESTQGTSSFTLETAADDVLAVVDHQRLARFHLVGHSMGGQIAQLVAARFPSR